MAKINNYSGIDFLVSIQITKNLLIDIYSITPTNFDELQTY